MNIPKLTHEFSVLMASWNNPELLKRSIPILKQNSKLDTKIFVALNDSDKESADFLRDEKIAFISVPYNAGTQIVDALLPLCRSEYSCWINDDCYVSKGYDLDCVDIIKEYYPAAVQCRSVEKRTSTDNIVVGDPTLPEWFAENAYEEFQKRVDEGKYNVGRHFGLFHPIVVKTEDVKDIGGFGDGLNLEAFFPGHSCDSMTAFNLYWLDSRYKFIISGSSFNYHYSSYTNKKLKEVDPEANNRHNSETFNRLAGMTQKQFHKLVKYGEPVLE